MSGDNVSNLYHNFQMATFIITYKCPFKCPMCFFNSGPDRKEKLEEDFVLKALDEMKELKIPVIGIAGGEPFIQFQLLREIIKKSASLGMRIIVITNAFWAISEKKAIKQLEDLKKAGLKRIQISLDEQHLQFIPIERIANAVNAAINQDYEDVKILGTSIGNSEKFKYQLFYLQEFLGVPLNQVDIIDRPRTSHEFYEDHEQTKYSFEDLENTDILNLPVKRPGDCLSEMMVDVNGDIYPCCNNFIGRIGNLHQTSLLNILQNLEDNEYFKIIKEYGPFHLARYLDNTEASNFQDQHYSNWCDLCSRIFQNKSFQDILMAKSLPIIKDRFESIEMHYEIKNLKGGNQNG